LSTVGEEVDNFCEICEKLRLMKIKFICSLLACALFSSCTSFTGYQTGRTLGKGKSEITTALNGVVIKDEAGEDFLNVNVVPLVEVHYQRGVAEKLDIGIKLTTGTSFTADLKWQFLGDKTSKFAASTGFAIGGTGLNPFAGQLQVPLYLSVHPTEKMAVYLSPRYIGLMNQDDAVFHAPSVSAGLIYGKRTKFALDFSYIDLGGYSEDESQAALFNFGVGVKIPLGKK
jgi:hypothetical protein